MGRDRAARVSWPNTVPVTVSPPERARVPESTRRRRSGSVTDVEDVDAGLPDAFDLETR